jgi:toxin YoeB
MSFTSMGSGRSSETPLVRRTLGRLFVLAKERGRCSGEINDLLKDISRSPFKGLGKPEPLKRNLAGWWSRRITGEHRLVYRVIGKPEERLIEVVQCRFHY